jgi:myo-inositol-1-phosphate synthase
MPIRVAIAKIGNCASALVRGVGYYKNVEDKSEVPGIMHVLFGNYHIKDIEFVAAFDVNRLKIGKDLSETIFAEPNCCFKFSDVPNLGLSSSSTPILDSVAPHMTEPFKAYNPDETETNVAEVLKETEANMLANRDARLFLVMIGGIFAVFLTPILLAVLTNIVVLGRILHAKKASERRAFCRDKLPNFAVQK